MDLASEADRRLPVLLICEPTFQMGSLRAAIKTLKAVKSLSAAVYGGGVVMVVVVAGGIVGPKQA